MPHSRLRQINGAPPVPKAANEGAAKRSLDLNLLKTAVVLFEEGSVSRAAERLGLSQPSVSGNLAKLRDYFDDPLFVRSATGMSPTPLTQSIISPVQQVLLRIEREILAKPSFDPTTTERPFTIALSDVGEMVFLPPLLRRFEEVAPQSSIASVTLRPNELCKALENGQVDVAVGYFPDLERAGFFRQRLLSHRFVCLLRADHPIQSKSLTLGQFVSLRHAVVHSEGRSQEIFERFLQAQGIRRTVGLSTPHFMSIPTIISRSDMVVTVPHAVGMAYGRPALNLRTVEPPFATPSIELRQHWHARFHKDQRHSWLRREISVLFNDQSDEWTAKSA